MKTAKYFIQFQNIEIDMSAKIEISKKEYENQFALLTKKVADSGNEEYPMEHLHYEYELPTYILYRDYFSVGCADTVLCKEMCKEGYRFKTKKESQK